ncbi:MAG: family 43 glycosylhydrolase [Rikenellaceae bacterium]
MTKTRLFSFLAAGAILVSCQGGATAQEQTKGAFPFIVPAEKPNRPLSSAMNRFYDQFDGKQPHDNELFSQFKYTDLKGFDYNDFDGTISRRDPSRIIFHNNKYYFWYTKRQTKCPPVGGKNAESVDDETPTVDWDLAELWYATSEDGFNWKEEGVAVPRPPKPQLGHRAVTTTEILEWKGKFYLYFQAFNVPSGMRGDDCPVSVAVADSPDGPWKHSGKIVIPNGAEGEWDQFSIHDPHPLVHDGKIYMYYKSDFGESPNLVRMQGLAIGDDPLGPFVKHPLNPVINSGHETGIFPYGKGVAALVYKDGPEHNTIQYAEDWVNFEVVSITEMMPYAASFFMPDAMKETDDARGVTWGMAHFINYTGNWSKMASKLVRFDCDLSKDVDDPRMHEPRINHKPEVYYKQSLTPQQRKRIAEETAKLRK